MNKIKRRIIIFIFTLTLLFAINYNCYSAMMAFTTEELTLKSQDIIIGTVQKTHSYWNNDKTLIYTDVTIKVDEFIKRTSPEDIIVIRVIGGIVGDVGLKVSEIPVFANGEEVLLFLENDPVATQIKKVVGSLQGKFLIKQNEQTLEKEVFSESGVRVTKEGTVFIDPGKKIPLTTFVTLIKDTIANGKK